MMISATTTKSVLNKPDAVNPAMTLQHAIDDHWRRVTDLGRWAEPVFHGA
jgi:hypothetical protein